MPIIQQTLVLLNIAYFAKSSNIDEFVKRRIVPDIIDDVPKSLAEVFYLNAKVGADLGNEIEPKETAEQPLVMWNADEETSYTILMVDPDVPSRQNPEMRSMLHWLVGNIPGENLTYGDYIVDYMGPLRSSGLGFHRYVVLVYEQSDSIIDYSHLIGVERKGFNVRNFTSSFNLGVAFGGNFFIGVAPTIEEYYNI